MNHVTEKYCDCFGYTLDIIIINIFHSSRGRHHTSNISIENNLTFFTYNEQYRTLTNAPKQIGETKVAVRNSVNLKGPSFELLKTNVKFIADHISPDREVDASMLQRNVSPQKAPEPIQNYPAQSKGKLVCNGQSTDSEMAYWKKVAGDENFESPFTPHHKNHNDR